MGIREFNTKINPIDFAKQMETLGAGELLVNSIDADGTMAGYDLKLVEGITKSVSIPVIACGGAGSIKDMHEVVNQTIGQIRENSKFLSGQRTELEKFYKTLRKDLGYNEIDNQEVKKSTEEENEQNGQIMDNRSLNDMIKQAMIKKDGEKIFQDINNTDWDLFWLGCKNRKNIVKYKNNCFQVSSTSYAQSYLIKRNMCEFIINNFYDNNFYCQPVTPDELLTLSPYGIDVVLHPEKYNFYNLDSPLNTLPTHFKHLCYKYPLTTQYSSYSDLWHREVNYEDYIQIKYPI